jgi:prevent-host-death family protein
MSQVKDLDNISVAEAKTKLSEKLRSVENRGRRYLITSHGKPRAVIISYKEYLSLVQSSDKPTSRNISLEKWKSESNERNRVIESVSSTFNTSTLSRKGQKEYKQNGVKETRKAKKRSG